MQVKKIISGILIFGFLVQTPGYSSRPVPARMVPETVSGLKRDLAATEVPLVGARSEARKLVVREDAREGDLAQLWGDKTVNGRVVNVEETILWLYEQLIGDIAGALDNWKKMEALANALIDRGAKPEEVYAFLASEFPAKRIDQNGNTVTATADEIYEGGINNFLLAMGEEVPVSPYRWAMNETVQASERSRQEGLVLTGPGHDLGMLFGAFNARRSGVSSRLEDSEDASPEMSGKQIWIQQLNLKLMYEGRFKDGRFVHPTKKYLPTDPEVTGGKKKAGDPKEYILNVGLDEAPAPFHRLAGLHLTLPSVTIGGKRVPSFISVMAVFLLNNFDNLKKNGFDAGFYLAKSKWPLDMFVWNKALFLMEERIGAPHGTLKAKVMHERAEFSISQFVNMWVVQMYSLITNVGRWDQNNSFIQMFKRFPSMLFPDQRFAGMLTSRMTYYTWRNAFFNVLVGVTPETAKKIDPKKLVQLIELTNALAEGGMAVQLKNNPKPDDSAEIAAAKLKFNTNAISDIRIDKIRERLIGLQVFVKSNGQKILFDSTRESWVATTDSEYVRAGSEPFQVKLNENGSTLEEIVAPLQSYVDRNVTPAMRGKLVALGILGERGEIKPVEFTADDLTKEKIDSLENWKRLMMPSKGERTIEGLAQEIFFTFDYDGQQVAGNNAAAVENPLDGNGWRGILEASYTGNRLMSDHATNEGNSNGLYVSEMHRQKFTQDGKFEDLTGQYPPIEVKAGDPITPDIIYQVWLRLRAFTDMRLANFEKKRLPVNHHVADLAMEVVKRMLIKTDETGEPVKDAAGKLMIQPVDTIAYFSKILYRMNELYRNGRLDHANEMLNAIFIKKREELTGLALEIHDDVFNISEAPAVFSDAPIRQVDEAAYSLIRAQLTDPSLDAARLAQIFTEVSQKFSSSQLIQIVKQVGLAAKEMPALAPRAQKLEEIYQERQRSLHPTAPKRSEARANMPPLLEQLHRIIDRWPNQSEQFKTQLNYVKELIQQKELFWAAYVIRMVEEDTRYITFQYSLEKFRRKLETYDLPEALAKVMQALNDDSKSKWRGHHDALVVQLGEILKSQYGIGLDDVINQISVSGSWERLADRRYGHDGEEEIRYLLAYTDRLGQVMRRYFTYGWISASDPGYFEAHADEDRMAHRILMVQRPLRRALLLHRMAVLASNHARANELKRRFGKLPSEPRRSEAREREVNDYVSSGVFSGDQANRRSRFQPEGLLGKSTETVLRQPRPFSFEGDLAGQIPHATKKSITTPIPKASLMDTAIVGENHTVTKEEATSNPVIWNSAFATASRRYDSNMAESIPEPDFPVKMKDENIINLKSILQGEPISLEEAEAILRRVSNAQPFYIRLDEEDIKLLLKGGPEAEEALDSVLSLARNGLKIHLAVRTAGEREQLGRSLDAFFLKNNKARKWRSNILTAAFNGASVPSALSIFQADMVTTQEEASQLAERLKKAGRLIAADFVREDNQDVPRGRASLKDKTQIVLVAALTYGDEQQGPFYQDKQDKGVFIPMKSVFAKEYTDLLAAMNEATRLITKSV